MTVDRNLVTKPKTTTVISDQNGRSTITSTERPVMYTSCSRTALHALRRHGRLPPRAICRNTSSSVGLLDVDVQDLRRRYCRCRRWPRGTRCSSVVTTTTLPSVERRRLRSRAAARSITTLRLAVEAYVDAASSAMRLVRSARRVLGDDAAVVQEDDLVADARHLVHLVAGVDDGQVARRRAATRSATACGRRCPDRARRSARPSARPRDRSAAP